MSNDAHRFFLDIDDSYCTLRAVCPYPPDDQDRPCWPHHQSGDDDMVPDEPPQTICIYEDWLDNMGFDEIAHGSTSVELEGAWIDWSNGDYPIVQLAPVRGAA